MNELLIPAMGSEQAKKSFEKGKWKNFARRLTKNPFMKEYVFERVNGLCPWCGKPLRKRNLHGFHVHHIDYFHQCKTSAFIEVPSPTEKRPDRKYKVPHCEDCKNTTPLACEECVRRVVAVHKLCNRDIEQTRIELQG